MIKLSPSQAGVAVCTLVTDIFKLELPIVRRPVEIDLRLF